MAGLYGEWVEKPVAYCALHKCALSFKQMKKRDCVRKGCWHMRKLEHPYWVQRERIAELRKERKARLCK